MHGVVRVSWAEKDGFFNLALGSETLKQPLEVEQTLFLFEQIPAQTRMPTFRFTG